MLPGTPPPSTPEPSAEPASVAPIPVPDMPDDGLGEMDDFSDFSSPTVMLNTADLMSVPGAGDDAGAGEEASAEPAPPAAP